MKTRVQANKGTDHQKNGPELGLGSNPASCSEFDFKEREREKRHLSASVLTNEDPLTSNPKSV